MWMCGQVIKELIIEGTDNEPIRVSHKDLPTNPHARLLLLNVIKGSIDEDSLIHQLLNNSYFF
jgi:hypothetical protein